jgi:hypothetical protein
VYESLYGALSSELLERRNYDDTNEPDNFSGYPTGNADLVVGVGI